MESTVNFHVTSSASDGNSCAATRALFVTIGHTDGCGALRGSHDIGTPSPGMRRYNNDLIFDARWRGRQGSGSCKGYCCDVVLEMMRDPERMADILDFACARERGVVSSIIIRDHYS